MSKSVLLLQMIDLLRERPGMDIGQLSATLGRSARTIYRYLESLSSELHTPIYCERGGYYVAERSVEGRLSLSPKEVLAVRMALTSGPLSRGGPFGEHAISAWKRIESALTSDAVEEVESAVKRHSIYSSPLPQGEVEPKVTSTIADAIERNKRLSVVYRSHRSGETKNLVIDPYALVFRRHNWYLIAHSRVHGHLIQLKLVRMVRAVDTGETFEVASSFSVDRFYAKSWEMWTGDEERLVSVKFSPRVAQIIRESKRHPTQELEDTPDGGVIFSVRVAGLDEISFWILSWGADAEVLEPDDLRAAIEETVCNLVDVYFNSAHLLPNRSSTGNSTGIVQPTN